MGKLPKKFTSMNKNRKPCYCQEGNAKNGRIWKYTWIFFALTQVVSLKYLGIIIDSKLTLREHINYITDKCSKLIFALSKSAKINWGISHDALKSIYTGAILLRLPCGAPIWVNALTKDCYNKKLTRVQRLINIRIAKSYRTVSNEALCMIAGLTPIDIKIKETSQLFQITKEKKRGGAVRSRHENKTLASPSYNFHYSWRLWRGREHHTNLYRR